MKSVSPEERNPSRWRCLKGTGIVGIQHSVSLQQENPGHLWPEPSSSLKYEFHTGMDTGNKKRVGIIAWTRYLALSVCVAESLRLIEMFPLAFFTFGGTEGWARVSCNLRLNRNLLCNWQWTDTFDPPSSISLVLWIQAWAAMLGLCGTEESNSGLSAC